MPPATAAASHAPATPASRAAAAVSEARDTYGLLPIAPALAKLLAAAACNYPICDPTQCRATLHYIFCGLFRLSHLRLRQALEERGLDGAITEWTKPEVLL